MPAKKEISLLPDQENANSPINKVIKWLTTVGRVVIIITEFVVISAFLSRFWLDRKNSDLSEILRQQKAILESTKDFEAEYNLLQQRLKVIEDFYSKDNPLDEKITSLVASIPPTISVTNISVKGNDPELTTSIISVAYQEEAIIDYITNLTVNPDVKSVVVKRIEKRSKDSKYYVDITVGFKGLTKKAS